MFGKKERDRINELLGLHIEKVDQTLKRFKECIYAYIEDGPSKDKDARYNVIGYEVHKLENEADDLRRELQRKLYIEASFLPELREDYVNLTELIDQVADIAEHTTDNLVLLQPDIPSSLNDDIKELVDLTLNTYGPIDKIVKYLLTNKDLVFENCKMIEDNEDLVDKKEWHVIKDLFDLDIPIGNKIIIREIVQSIAMISNQIEDVSDKMEVMVIKRQV